MAFREENKVYAVLSTTKTNDSSAADSIMDSLKHTGYDDGRQETEAHKGRHNGLYPGNEHVAGIFQNQNGETTAVIRRQFNWWLKLLSKIVYLPTKKQ